MFSSQSRELRLECVTCMLDFAESVLFDVRLFSRIFNLGVHVTE
jgi:hypothetical protein